MATRGPILAVRISAFCCIGLARAVGNEYLDALATLRHAA
jgi:hypothetical protein